MHSRSSGRRTPDMHHCVDFVRQIFGASLLPDVGRSWQVALNAGLRISLGVRCQRSVAADSYRALVTHNLPDEDAAVVTAGCDGRVCAEPAHVSHV